MFFVLMIAMFIAGYVSKKPEIETQTKVEKVYSLPEGVTLQSICNSFYGEEEDRIKGDMKQQAQDMKQRLEQYEQGYRDGVNQ